MKQAIAFILSLITITLFSMALVSGNNWFLVDTFNTPVITGKVMFGIVLLYSIFNIYTSKSVSEEEAHPDRLLVYTIAKLIAVVIGYLLMYIFYIIAF